MNSGNDEYDGRFDDDGNRHKRRVVDQWWKFFIPVVGSIVLAIFGWAVNLQIKVDHIATTQTEREPRFTAIEQQIKELVTIARDPAPRPETRVELKAIDERLGRLEERVNSLHAYILALPIRPAPVPYAPPSKRGEADLKQFLEKQL